MGGFGGNLTTRGQTNSLFSKNIDAKYRAPKNARLFGLTLEESEPLSIAQLIARIPTNYLEQQSSVTGDKWEDSYEWFSGKDGQTNAYVKRGMDFELSEIADGFETPVVTWHFATDDTHIQYQVGAKVYTAGREWTVLKVVNQYSRGTATNKFFAMSTAPEVKSIQRMGYATLVMV